MELFYKNVSQEGVNEIKSFWISCLVVCQFRLFCSLETASW
jgi:hypothetical protein